MTIFDAHYCSDVLSDEDLEYAGLRNNTTTSIAVPAGYLVELYDYHGFYGHKEVVEGQKNISRKVDMRNHDFK